MANDVLVLGTGNIKKLLLEYSIPAIIAMTAAALYNIVDSIFIGHGVGSLALSGLAITFPLMNLSAAFGSLIGAGGSTLVSIKMGQKDVDDAEKVLGNVVSLNIILGIVFMILGIAFLKPILTFFGASESTLPYAYEYMFIILLGNVVTHLYLGLNNTMRSSGYPRKAMYITLMTVVVNAILDPLFIFGFGWGIRGAATATILAQIIALALVIVHFCNKNHTISFKRGIFRLYRRIVSGIFSIGMAPFMLNACACLVVVIINKALFTHGGDLAIGAYGIMNRIVMMFVMLVVGFNQGMQPIAGYNFGAQQLDRVKEVLRQTIFYATGVMCIAFVACVILPKFMVSMFTTDQELIDLAAFGLRIDMAVSPIIGFQIVVSNYFQSIGQASKAMFMSSTRQLIFLIPLLLILPNFFGTTGVWLSMPISDTLATILAVIMLFSDKTLKKNTRATK